MKMWEVSH